MKTIRIKGLFQPDTKRSHRFDLTANGIVGNLYVPREDEGPDIIEAEVKTRADEPKTVLNVTERKVNLPRFSLN